MTCSPTTRTCCTPTCGGCCKPPMHASSASGHRRARLLRLTPRAITAPPARARGFVQRHRGAGGPGHRLPRRQLGSPIEAQWAAVRPRSERAVLKGHQDWVRAVCAVTVDGPPPARQRRRRQHGADLGPRHRPAAHRPRRPPEQRQRPVRGHRERPPPARQRQRRPHGADLGPRHRPAARRPPRPPGQRSTPCARSP